MSQLRFRITRKYCMYFYFFIMLKVVFFYWFFLLSPFFSAVSTLMGLIWIFSSFKISKNFCDVEEFSAPVPIKYLKVFFSMIPIRWSQLLETLKLFRCSCFCLSFFRNLHSNASWFFFLVIAVLLFLFWVRMHVFLYVF